MRTCVTGGAGFIGSHLVERLVAEGHVVTVLDDLSTGRLENLAAVRERVAFVEGDIRDRAAVARAVLGAEVVFHQAAAASVERSIARPLEVNAINVDGTLQVLQAAREAGVRRLVFASSSATYGDVGDTPAREEDPPRPLSPYAASKVVGEAYLSAWQACFGLETVALRYFNVFGSRQPIHSDYAAVVPLFVEAAQAGRALTIYGDGLQTRDFAFVGDVVDAVLSAATAARAIEGPINVGVGHRTSILDLAGVVARACSMPLRVQHEPGRSGEARHTEADISRARAWLGWEPRVGLEEGIRRMVEPGAGA